MSPEVVQLVDALAKISAPVWASYIYQQQLHGYLLIFAAVALGIFFLSCVSKFNKAPEVKPSSDMSSKDGWMIASVASFAFALVCLATGFVRIINPVYYAAQTLLGR